MVGTEDQPKQPGSAPACRLRSDRNGDEETCLAASKLPLSAGLGARHMLIWKHMVIE